MAAVSLAMTPAASVEELLASLEPNVMPEAPSIWPFALGYWLILAFTILVVGLLFFIWLKNKTWRMAKKQIAELKVITSPEEQLIGVHQLIRWSAHRFSRGAASLSDREFKNWLEKTLDRPCPFWFNGHYLPEPVQVDWSEAEQLLRHLIREVKP